MDMIKINYNVNNNLFNKLLFYYKNIIELFNNSSDIKNIKIKFNNKLNYNVILISIIAFSIVIYLLYFYNYKFYIFIIFSSIIRIGTFYNVYKISRHN